MAKKSVRFSSVKKILAWYDEGKITEAQLAICLETREAIGSLLRS